MVLPGIGEVEMDMLLDKICKAVYETEVPGYARLRLSASIGGVITGNEPIENAVGRADRLMYQAKIRKTVLSQNIVRLRRKTSISSKKNRRRENSRY